MNPEDDLTHAAHAFLRAAWTVLEEMHVVPTPWFHPYIEVGRDYSGLDIMALREFKDLEALISKSSPRFGESVPPSERDFPSGYIFSFLEAFVAASAGEDHPFGAASDASQELTTQLRYAVEATSWDVGCCRVVSHLTTADAQDATIAGVSVAPIRGAAEDTSRNIGRAISAVIKGAGTAFGRDDPHVYAPPESVIAVQDRGPDPFALGDILSGQLERFLLAVRLLWAGTCESVFEIQGETEFIRRFTPRLVRFRGAGPSLVSPTTRVRRTVRLEATDAPRIKGLFEAIERAEQPRQGMAMTSFAVAVQKLQLSYHAHSWDEQLVDLSTAFEAALSGRDSQDVLLRLRSRAAALLATDDDPAEAIFHDVGTLYTLRSRLIHGGELTEAQLKKLIMKVTTVPPDAPLGTATGHLIDRLRDLVRRGVLARICLASDRDEAFWPLNADPNVDAVLADDASRTRWRQKWRDELSSFDALFAADRPRHAVDAISQDDT